MNEQKIKNMKPNVNGTEAVSELMPLLGNKKIKVLNLYAGIGGNRKLWENVDVTAVEINENIAEVYQQFFPDDKLIIGDAHQYLLEHHNEYDFIWTSPPCQTHSMTNHFLKGQGIKRFPDMKLWQEILFLKHFYDGKYVVENVNPYYDVFIPGEKIGRHIFWANFKIGKIDVEYQIGTMNRKASKESQRKAIIREAQIPELIDLHGLQDFDIPNKRQVLRNCVLPKIGKHVFDRAMNIFNEPEKEQGALFA